jgi:uncharacterized protein (TIGR02284 family)
MNVSRTLDHDTVKKLQDLLSMNIDSQKGFQEASQTTSDPSLKQLFNEFGESRAHNAAELREYIRASGEQPTSSGTVSGTLHRWWIDAKQALSGNDAQSVLTEAERGEDSIKHTYEDVLTEISDIGARSVVERQYSRVKDAHDRVRQLRDAAKLRNPRE